MVIEKINGFKLYSKVYMAKGRPCRVFLPSIEIDGNEKFYWVRYVDDDDVGATGKSGLTTNLAMQVLYG